ncbi:MAG: hypothetical protein Q8P84_00850 [Deltaproteobacteria bacterium]|nr:hypothetical protein [Deltaproteobacteria bacterium]
MSKPNQHILHRILAGGICCLASGLALLEMLYQNAITRSDSMPELFPNLAKATYPFIRNYALSRHEFLRHPYIYSVSLLIVCAIFLFFLRKVTNWFYNGPLFQWIQGGGKKEPYHFDFVKYPLDPILMAKLKNSFKNHDENNRR